MSKLGILLLVLSELGYAASPLRHVTIEVNGRQSTISHKEALPVFRGDQVKLIGARLEDGSSPKNINLVGFRKSNSHNPFDDTGKLFLVGLKRRDKWAVGEDGRRFSILVSSNGRVHGEAFLRVSDPKIQSVDVMVNNAQHSLLPGQGLSLAPQHQFKLLGVKANFDVSDPEFRYEVKAIDGRHGIYLSRYGQDIGFIPIKVQ